MSKNVTDYFPSTAQVNAATESEADRDPVATDVSGDIVNPQGDEVINVGNTSLNTPLTITEDYTLNEAGDSIQIIDQDLADSVKVGDRVEVTVVGIADPIELSIKDINTVTGEITFNTPAGDDVNTLLTQINSDDSTINIVEELPTFAGVADQAESFLVENLTQTGIVIPAMGPNIITDVVTVTTDQYDELILNGTPDTSTLYLITEDVIT